MRAEIERVRAQEAETLRQRQKEFEDQLKKAI